MRFWDSSAVVPLIVDEPETAAVRRLLEIDADIVTSHLTALEITSALWRRRHNGDLTAEAHQQANEIFAFLTARWTTVSAEAVLEIALDLLSRHPLRAADSVQLASAWVFRQRYRDMPFVTLDERLAAAARSERFVVLP